MEPATSPAQLRLVVGLGNPGSQYLHTRHNLGFSVLDSLAKKWSSPWKKEPSFFSESAKSQGITLLKPQTFMNLSGNAVLAFASYYKISPQEILVVSDDSSLPTGTLRIRKTGSSGGHNGLSSIINSLKSKEIPRLRIGIDQHGSNLSSHVLGLFSPEETPSILLAIESATEAILTICDKGLDIAMNKYNSR